MKTCKKCGETKPATTDNFYTSKTNKDGFRLPCKECAMKRQKDYNLEHRDEILDYQKTWYRDNQDKILERSKEYQQLHKEERNLYRKVYYQENRDKELEQRREYYQENKEEKLKYNKQHYEENKEYYLVRNQNRRAKNNGNDYSLTKDEWLECLKFFDWKDAYTGLPLEIIHLDHVVPLSKGGATNKSNIIPCEAEINLSKYNKDMEDWYMSQSFFNANRLQKIYRWMEINSKLKLQEEVI